MATSNAALKNFLTVNTKQNTTLFEKTNFPKNILLHISRAPHPRCYGLFRLPCRGPQKRLSPILSTFFCCPKINANRFSHFSPHAPPRDLIRSNVAPIETAPSNLQMTPKIPRFQQNTFQKSHFKITST